MKKVFAAILPALLSACTVNWAGSDPESDQATISSEILVQSTRSWDGGEFAYPDGDAQLTVVRIEIPAGVALPMHCHPVPLGGVLTKGVLEVKKETGEALMLNEGEGLIEVSNQWHYGKAVEDVEIMVVYAGAQEVPVTVLKDGDPRYVAECF